MSRLENKTEAKDSFLVSNFHFNLSKLNVNISKELNEDQEPSNKKRKDC